MPYCPKRTITYIIIFVMGWRKTGSYGVCLKLGGSSRKPAVIIEGF